MTTTETIAAVSQEILRDFVNLPLSQDNDGLDAKLRAFLDRRPETLRDLAIKASTCLAVGYSETHHEMHDPALIVRRVRNQHERDGATYLSALLLDLLAADNADEPRPLSVLLPSLEAIARRLEGWEAAERLCNDMLNEAEEAGNEHRRAVAEVLMLGLDTLLTKSVRDAGDQIARSPEELKAKARVSELVFTSGIYDAANSIEPDAQALLASLTQDARAMPVHA